MAGVGNLYKAEVCFLLGVSPWTPVSDVDVERAVRAEPRPVAAQRGPAPRSTTGIAAARPADLGVRPNGGRAACAAEAGCSHDQGPDLRERVAYYCPACQPGPHP